MGSAQSHETRYPTDTPGSNWLNPTRDFPSTFPLAQLSESNGSTMPCEENYYRMYAKRADLKPDVFQKLATECEIAYGDGGDSKLQYPVIVNPQLSKELPDGFNADLAIELSRLALLRNDKQQNGVVEDIVDPELFPQFLDTFQTTNTRVWPAAAGDTVKSKLINDCVRGTYAWIPSLVTFDGTKATFTSPIQNLPRIHSNMKLYTMLEALLSRFMASCVQTKGEYKVQVKLQRYVVPPGVSYTGKWHTEGVTEGVSAAAVYYVEWPEEFEGGALKFRPPSLPLKYFRLRHRRHSAGYAAQGLICRSIAIECGAGSAVAFRNSMPHRFETLMNTSDRPLVRSFVNFFLVERDLPTTQTVPTNADLLMALVPRTNLDVAQEVMEFLNFTPLTFKRALKLREVAKAEMVNYPTRWGCIHYGNSGEVDFLAAYGQKAIEFRRNKKDYIDGVHWKRVEDDDDEDDAPNKFDEDGCPLPLNPEYLKLAQTQGLTVDDVWPGNSMGGEYRIHKSGRCDDSCRSPKSYQTGLSGN